MANNTADRNYYIVSEIREACIKNDWFTCGTNEEYNEMFEMAKQMKPNSPKIHSDLVMKIYLCSDMEYSPLESASSDSYEYMNKVITKIIRKAYELYPEQATKEEELKAIEKIEKIVHGLGQDSYVGSAMDGVLDMARENIRDDAANSWRGNSEWWMHQYHDLKDELKGYKKEVEKQNFEITQLHHSIEEQEEIANKKDERVEAWQSKYDELHERYEEDMATAIEVISERDKLSKENEALKDEIFKLKAKLYDMMMA